MHEISRSPSVEVLLQQLPSRDFASLRRMSQRDVARFLARDREVPAIFRTALLDAGSLPAIRLGQVYRAGRRVGDLASSTLLLNMPGGENLMSEVLLGDNLEKPSGWAEKYNFRLLNPSQYELPIRDYDASRCIVRRDRHFGTEVDVVIPRTLIEQVFYYPDSHLVNVAAKGSWEAQKHALIVFKPMDNGLKTAICAETGAWKVVVRTLVLDVFAGMMAFFAHSPYAQRSANLIHTRALQERGLNRFAPWHASGRIPWDPEFGPFSLELRGFVLKSNRMKGSETFLATHVARWSLPEHVPDIERGRENSGDESEHGAEGHTRARGGRSERRGDSERTIQSGVDADPSQGNEGFDTTATAWLKEPRIRIQKKTSHVSAEGKPSSQPDESPQSHHASMGPDGSQLGNPAKATARTVLHPNVVSFGQTLKAFERLREERFISSFSVYGPPSAAQREERGEASCWNFLPDVLRRAENASGRLPRRGWCIVNPRESRPRPRAALVLRIVMANDVLYWIEIERRASETGMRSPILANIPEERVDSVIDWTLLRISENDGRNLLTIAQEAVGGLGPCATASVFQHAYAYEYSTSDAMGVSAAKAALINYGAHAQPMTGAASQSIPGTQRRVTGLNPNAIKRVLLRTVAMEKTES